MKRTARGEHLVTQIVFLWAGVSFPAWFGIPLTNFHFIAGLCVTLVVLIGQWWTDRKSE